MKIMVTIPGELVGVLDSIAEFTRQSRSSLVTLSLVKFVREYDVSYLLGIAPRDSSDISSSSLISLRSLSVSQVEVGSSSAESSSSTAEIAARAHQEPSVSAKVLPSCDQLKKRTATSRGALCASAEKCFLEWWELVPRKRAKGEARKAYGKALQFCGWTGGARDEKSLIAAALVLADGARSWTAGVQGKEARFVKLPATWLNKHCWEDEELDEWSKIGTALPARASDRSKREKLQRDTAKLAALEEQVNDGEKLSSYHQSEYDRLRQSVRGEV